MKKIMILLSLLMFLPLTAISKPLIPIMKTLFTDVTGTVPDAEEIAHKAELFRQQTGVVPFIVVLPDINNEASLRQNGKAMLAHAASSMSNVKGSVSVTLYYPRATVNYDNQRPGRKQYGR